SLRADRGDHDGRLRRARQRGGAGGGGALRSAGLPLRRGVGQRGEEEPGGHPARRVRGTRGEDAHGRMAAGFRTAASASLGEIVGLVPSAALVAAAEFYLQLERFGAEQILENKLKGD